MYFDLKICVFELQKIDNYFTKIPTIIYNINKILKCNTIININ